MAHDGNRKKAGKSGIRNGLPDVLQPNDNAPEIATGHGRFDIDDPELPEWIEKRAFRSRGYPYDDPIKSKLYEQELTALQVELVKLQRHVIDAGLRPVLVFEGRDAAGKGGCIFALHQYLNPRYARDVALPKPSETERGQWYFQRYVVHLPTAGEIVLYDRSWYNRAGVEPVMGFCTPEQQAVFLDTVPRFEKMLVKDGIVLFKFWLEIGRIMQLKRFWERRHDPLKIWKLSSIDYAAMEKWDAYTAARDVMFAASDQRAAPWTVVLANDQKRARINVIRHVLSIMDYPGKDPHVVGRPDPLILGSVNEILRKE